MSNDMDVFLADNAGAFIELASDHETPVNPVDLRSSFFGQLLNPTDFKITIEEFSFPVHKDLIAQMSGFFRTLCSSQFQEAQTNEVTLHDDNVAQVARMICWMYTGAYPYGPHESIPDTHKVTIEQMMRAALDGNDAQELNNLLPAIYDNDDKVAVDLGMYVMADKYDCDLLRDCCVARMFRNAKFSKDEAALWFIVQFIKEASVDTTRLKHRLHKYLSTRLRQLVGTPYFQEMIQDLPDVAVGLFKELAENNHRQSQVIQGFNRTDNMSRQGGRRH